MVYSSGAMVDYFSGVDIVTYHIYHDKHNREHEICIADWHTTQKKKDGVTISAPNRNDTNIIEYKENVNEGFTSKRVKYKNGDIAEYGFHSNKKGSIWRLYRALDEKIEIVRMPDEINYTKSSVTIKYRFSNTKRRYTGPGPLAGFIDALAEIGFELTTTGSCFFEASCFPSAEHVNGKSVDTLYKLNVQQDQKIIDAMAKFHFRERFIGISSYFYKLSNAQNLNDLHDTHLHSGDFDFDCITEIEN